jgi:uncharacterized protein with HEPN domain
MLRILKYTEGVNYQDFLANSMMRDAVIRNFEIMGESVRHVPFGFQKKSPKIPWQKMFAMRNFIVHEYFDVDDEILWQIIVHDLPRNVFDIEELLKDKRIYQK